MALHPQTVHARLNESARKLRASRSVRYMMSGATLALFFLIISLLLDARFHFYAAGRWIGFLLTMAPLAAGAVLSAIAWRPDISESSIARRIENATSNARNVLISAIQFDRSLPADSPLRRALFAEMDDPFPRVRWTDVFDLDLLKKIALALGGIALAIAMWAVINPAHFTNSAARIFLPASNIAPLTRTIVRDIKPGDAQVIHGGDFAVTVLLGGEVPKVAWVYFRDMGSSWQKAAMNREVGQPVFMFSWKQVRQPMEYYVEAGDAVSVTHQVTVRPKTVIRSKTADIVMPAYTKLGKSTVKDFNLLQNVTPGSLVTLTLQFNYPLTELRAMDEKGQSITTTSLDDLRWRMTAKVMGNTSFKLNFRDTDGFTDNDALQITVKPDEPPKINVIEPADGKELVASRDATIRISFSVTDNFGVGSLALYRSTSTAQDAKLVQQWSDVTGKLSFRGTAEVLLKQFSASENERLTFCLIAKDLNDVTGPGVAVSRPIVVATRAAEKARQEVDKAAAKLQQGLEDVIKLQKLNIEETRIVSRTKPPLPQQISALLNRQIQVADISKVLAASSELIAPRVRDLLMGLLQKEMKDAVLALRNASAATPDARAKFLAHSMESQLAILAQLQGAPETARESAQKGEIADLLAGLEALLKQQRDIYRETTSGTTAAGTLSSKQDALAEQSQKVRHDLERLGHNGPTGDKEFGKRVVKATEMFVQTKIYEEMLTAADKLSSKKTAEAAPIQRQVMVNLARIITFLNEWQLANANQTAADLKKQLEELKDKLNKLSMIQRDVVEKSKEQLRKDQTGKEDASTAHEIKETKDLMKDVIEQMLLDMHAFPEMKPSGEMKVELMTMFEDVIQADKEDAEQGKLKPQEIAVQKEDGLLQAIEQAKKIADDMEMWLPNKLETQKWLQENFDTHEMPEIPNLPLPEAMEDIVGNLLKEQQGLADQVADAASNQALAMNPGNGWEVRDGQMPGFGAQGRSGNERPNHNEQMGRSSGGREGMSDGEMVGKVAKNLEGDKPDVRRTKDPMQQGMVQDEDGPSATRATGGGKAGAFSDRQGMEGNSPLRSSNAPRQLTSNAAAVAQSLLAEKTAKTAAEANLLYLKAHGMTEVARLMDESQQALREGRLRDFSGLHQKIVRQLQDVKSEVTGREVTRLSGDPARAVDKQLLGAAEGEVPAQYKDMAADYYRSLTEEK